MVNLSVDLDGNLLEVLDRIHLVRDETPFRDHLAALQA